jgi:hypothetical protein
MNEENRTKKRCSDEAINTLVGRPLPLLVTLRAVSPSSHSTGMIPCSTGPFSLHPGLIKFSIVRLPSSSTIACFLNASYTLYHKPFRDIL